MSGGVALRAERLRAMIDVWGADLTWHPREWTADEAERFFAGDVCREPLQLVM